MSFKILQFLCVLSTLSSLTLCAVLPRNRLSEADTAEWVSYNIKEPEGPGTYSFGFDVEDPETGNVQFRSEERHLNGTITGSYGYMTPDGYVHIVHYVADNLGYRTKIEEGGRLKPHLRVKNMDRTHQSSKMKAALQSIKNFHPSNKINDQHIRPVDRTPAQYSKNVAVPEPYSKNVPVQHLDNEEFYHYYYVPSRQIFNY